jgi:hypothetical protein
MNVLPQEEFEIVIKNSDLQENIKKELLENSKPFYELSEFIQKKFNISAAGAELMLRLYMQVAIEKLGNAAYSMDEKELISILITDYAKKHGFEKYEGLGHSWLTLVNISNIK